LVKGAFDKVALKNQAFENEALNKSRKYNFYLAA